MAFRPRLPKREKARAILRAFGFHGNPYDFDFSFATNDTIVCTELVYKSYQPDGNAGMTGVRFPSTMVLGRPVMPANLIVRQFDETHGTTDQQLDLVELLDGRERDDIAVVETVDTLRKSWKRPKWHIFMQKR